LPREVYVNTIAYVTLYVLQAKVINKIKIKNNLIIFLIIIFVYS